MVIDANSDWVNHWAKIRPRDKFRCAAISRDQKQYYYIKNAKYPACNRLTDDPKSELTADESLSAIRTERIMNLLNNSHVKLEDVDFINIDCEGYDLEVLQDIDWNRCHPSLIAAEDNDFRQSSHLVQFLELKKYQCIASIGVTKIFKRMLPIA